MVKNSNSIDITSDSHLTLSQAEKILTILKAASIDVEPYWPGLFAKAVEGINVKDLITNVGSGVGAAAPAGAAVAGKDFILYSREHVCER